MKTKAQEIDAQIKTLGNEVMAIYKEHNDAPTGDALKAVQEKRAKMDELHAEYLVAEEQVQGKDAVKAHLDRIANPGKRSTDYGDGRAVPQIKTIADMVMEDPAFKSWFEEKMKTGGPSGEFRSPDVEGVSLKTLVTGASSTSAGAFVRTDYDTDVPLPYREINMRNLVTIGTTGSDLVSYVEETGRTNNAAVVAEATATTGSSGASPESALGFVQREVAVQDISTWVPATRRALSDVGMMRTLIETELRAMVAEKFEDVIISTILGTSGINTQAYTTDLLVTTRKALTKTRVTGLAKPNGYVFHPQDWEKIELMQDNEGRFYLGGPGEEARPYLWSNPVTQNVGLTEGIGLTGDFRQVKVWDREQTAIYTSNTHSDFFVRSISVLLCVMRAAVAVKRPAAITEIDLTA